MKIKKGVALIIGILFFAFAFQENLVAQQRPRSNTQSSEPSLQETTQWLEGKTDEIIGIYLAQLSSGKTAENIGSNSITSMGKLITEASDNCSIIWQAVQKKPSPLTQTIEKQEKPNKKREDKNAQKATPTVIVSIPPPFAPISVTLPLGNFNPLKVEVIKVNHRGRYMLDLEEGFDWWVKMYTTNNKRLIKWQGVNDSEESNGIVIAFRTEEMAQRVAKAFRHLITICGGQQDSKEPF